MRMSGPVLDAPDVAELTHFYEQLLGWEVEELDIWVEDLAAGVA
jgi:predicted enzyme related to lactoylglutathione lyase